MISEAYRYRFTKTVYLPDAEATLHVAILAAEGLFGEAHVRLDAAYTVDESSRSFVVDAGTDVGQAVNEIFTAFALREFGRDAFTVHCVDAETGCTFREDDR